MLDYKTTREMAAEWNVSPQHVQYLCRKGRIKGAIKKAGTWFLPGDTPSPVQYTKSGIEDFRFVGTKSKIFDSAIELFMQKGFNDVSLKDIAEQVGIQQSTIYNHFQSKQEILDTIYDFYCSHYLMDRLSTDEMEPVLWNKSIQEIIGSISYVFKEDYLKKMMDITSIILQRITIDERAKEIGKSLIVDEGVRYVEAVFDRGIEIGRFTSFNTHTISMLINCIRMFVLYRWIMNPSPESMTKLSEDEQALNKYLIKQLTDLEIPIQEEKNGNIDR